METDFDFVCCPACQSFIEVGALYEANSGEAVEGAEGLTACPECGEFNQDEEWVSE